MAEEIIPQLKFETIAPQEADLDRLAGEVLKHKESPEMRGASGQELIKRALTTMAPPPVPAAAGAAVSGYIPDYAAGASPASRAEIEHLVEMALKDGIAKAQSEAAKSNPFVLDAFHDALSGKLYPELQKRKIVD